MIKALSTYSVTPATAGAHPGYDPYRKFRLLESGAMMCVVGEGGESDR
jgi:hypothetical protein